MRCSGRSITNRCSLTIHWSHSRRAELQRRALLRSTRERAVGVGGIEDARRDLETARRLDAKDGTAFALSAIIDVALNDRKSALENGQRAVALSPD